MSKNWRIFVSLVNWNTVCTTILCAVLTVTINNVLFLIDYITNKKLSACFYVRLLLLRLTLRSPRFLSQTTISHSYLQPIWKPITSENYQFNRFHHNVSSGKLTSPIWFLIDISKIQKTGEQIIKHWFRQKGGASYKLTPNKTKKNAISKLRIDLTAALTDIKTIS